MKFLFALLFFIPVLGSSQTTMIINGSFADLPDGVTIKFSHHSSQVPMDSTISKDKKFRLKAELPFTGLCLVNFSGAGVNASFQFFVGAETVQLTGTIKYIKETIVTGAAHQMQFQQFEQLFSPLFNELNETNTKINSSQNIEERNAGLDKFNQQVEQIQHSMDSFITKHPVSLVSAFLAYVTKDLFLARKPVEFQEILKKIDGDAKTSAYYTTVKQELDKLLVGSIGSEAIDFTQNDVSGSPVKLSSFRGKYVLLDFWASWCGPCRGENPNLVEAFNKFKNKNFTVLGVSLDRPGGKDAWLKAIKDDNLTWTHVSDLQFWQNGAAQLYRVTSIPANFLIDPQGKIIAKNLRGQALDDKLCEIFGCK